MKNPLWSPTRVLVVDDERFFREAIRELLEGEGLSVRMAQTAAEALEGASDPQVGVVVLDIQLPDRSGLEVLRVVRERRPELRVVMLSAHTDQEYVLEALRLGACDYLAKPLHEEEMRLSVRRALEAHDLASRFRALGRRVGSLAAELEGLFAEAASAGAEGVAGRLAEAAGRLVDATKTSVMLRDRDDDRLRVVAATGRKLAPEELDAVPVGGGVAGRAVAQGEPIRVHDVATDARFAGPAAERYDTGSFVVMPVGAGTGAFGALCVTDRRGAAPFEDEDEALLRVLALAASPLLEPARGAAAERPGATVAGHDAAASPDAELARAVCEVMTREVDPDRLLRAALSVVSDPLHAAPVSVFLLDAATGALRREAQWEADGPSDRPALPRGRGLTGAAFEAGQPVACAAPDDDPRFDAEVDTPEGGRVGPLLVLPLRFRGRTLGVFRAFPAHADAAAPRTAEVLAAALSAALRNALLCRSLVESIEEVAQVRREAAGAPRAGARA